MKFFPIFLASSLLILTGCDSDGTVVEAPAGLLSEATPVESTGIPVGTSTPILIQLMFAGATFVAVDDPDANPESGDGVLSFTEDTVTWTRPDLVEVGTYTDTGDSVLVASFPDRDISFEENGFNLIWDSRSYLRAGNSLFDSQESLVTFFDGTTFNTIEAVASGVSQTADQAVANRSLQFDGNEVTLLEDGAVSVGTYTNVDGKSFTVNFPDNELLVVVLNRNMLVADSVIYNRDLFNQFDSQETLVEFLDGTFFRSTSLQSIGETSPGVTGVGFWSVDFAGDTFTWAFEGVAEAGTVSYLDTNRFTAILALSLIHI